VTTDKEKNKKPATKNTAKKSSKPASSVKKSRTAAKKTPVKKAVNKTDKKDKKQKVTEEQVVSSKSLPRLLARLREEIAPIMVDEFGYSSSMQVPDLTKIVLNIGIGEEASQNSQAIEKALGDLSMITGQKPIVTRARKSIAGFKLREGTPVGVTVTLRSSRMYEFLDRLISSSLPRIRDFRGVPPESFDGRGNYSLGIREQIIFPEIDYNLIDRIRGLQIIIVTTAKNDEEGRRFLQLMGMPFAASREESSSAA
tara:strand:+ start:188 stop:952 length:765 start_codon:yes stop_codon:yes gene_type:complete